LPHAIRKLALTVAVAAVLPIAACGSDAPDTTWVGASAPAAVPSTSLAPVPSPSATTTATPKPKITYAFPVVGKNSYAHTHHDYPASDVITACGHRFVAVTGGVILAVTRKDVWTAKDNAGATRGGLSVSLRGDDGVRYYGSHLSAIDAKVEVGERVTTGQTLGTTGESGDASACHLHFGISPPCAEQGDWFNQRGTVYPWRYLDSWREGGQKSPVAEVTQWHKKHGCPTKPTAFP
jgi:peptidoglycan LD-endopeptidase LytH